MTTWHKGEAGARTNVLWGATKEEEEYASKMELFFNS